MGYDKVPDLKMPLPGPKTLEKLERLGVRTIGDLAVLDERIVVGALGQASGAHLLALSRAHDERPVEVGRDPKSIGHEETYPHDLFTHEELERELVRLSDAVASRCSSRRTRGARRGDAAPPAEWCGRRIHVITSRPFAQQSRLPGVRAPASARFRSWLRSRRAELPGPGSLPGA